MMFGNVAPAPFSFTCAAAGAASVKAAASASSGDFVMRDASSWLERELGLEQGLRAGRIVRGVQGWGLIVGVVPVSEQPPVRRQLIRHTANEPRLLVRGTGLQVRDVDASEDCDFGVGDLVDTEPAVDVAVDRAQRTRLGRGSLPGEGEVLGPVGQHAQVAVALRARRGPAVSGVAREA